MPPEFYREYGGWQKTAGSLANNPREACWASMWHNKKLNFDSYFPSCSAQFRWPTHHHLNMEISILLRSICLPCRLFSKMPNNMRTLDEFIQTTVKSLYLSTDSKEY